jgi:hypothetical protein
MSYNTTKPLTRKCNEKLYAPTNINDEILKITKLLSCIYFFTLGEVKTLRNSMNIDKKYTDDMVVCRYGQTDDLARRASQHKNAFEKIKGVELNLKYYSYVDPQYNSNAESDIRSYFEAFDLGFDFEKNTELIIVKPTLFKNIEKQFKLISSEYAGHMKDMIKKVEDLKRDIELRNEKEKVKLLEKDNALLEKDKAILEKDKAMLEKDNKINMLEKNLEIAQLKNQLAQK